MEQAKRALTGVTFLADPYSCAESADAVVLMTEWDSLKSLDLARLRQAMRGPVMVDLRNIYTPEVAESYGFLSVGIGLPSRTKQPDKAPSRNVEPWVVNNHGHAGKLESKYHSEAIKQTGRSLNVARPAKSNGHLNGARPDDGSNSPSRTEIRTS